MFNENNCLSNTNVNSVRFNPHMNAGATTQQVIRGTPQKNNFLVTVCHHHYCEDSLH